MSDYWLERAVAKAQRRADRWVPPRKVYTSWSRAMTTARGYAQSTHWKHKVYKVRGGFFMVAKLDRSIAGGGLWRGDS